MLGIPNIFKLTELANFVKQFSMPQKLSIEEIDALTQDIKNLKSLKAQISSEKKMAQDPYEKDRAKYSDLFEKAKDDKKRAGEPFVQLENWVSNTEASLRSLIATTIKEEEQRKLKAEQEALIKKQEAERKEKEAQAAIEQARKTGDQLAEQQAVKAKQQAESAKFEADSAKTASDLLSSVVKPSNISSAKILDFIVEDISIVPTEYVEYVPNTDLIYKRIYEQFPFIEEMNVKVDVDKVPDEFMHDQVIQDKVMEDLRAEKKIPGIKVCYRERMVVR